MIKSIEFCAFLTTFHKLPRSASCSCFIERPTNFKWLQYSQLQTSWIYFWLRLWGLSSSASITEKDDPRLMDAIWALLYKLSALVAPLTKE